VSMSDPSGLCDMIGGGFGETASTGTPGPDPTAMQQALADYMGANLAYPFSGEGNIGSFLSSYFSLSPSILANAITNTVQQSNGGPTNLILFSGSAGILAEVLAGLPSNIRSGITSITLISPGNIPGLDSVSAAQNNNPNIQFNLYSGSSFLDALVMGNWGQNSLPCGHEANCLFGSLFTKLAAMGSGGCPNQTTFDRQYPHGHGRLPVPIVGPGGIPGLGGFGGGNSGDPTGGSCPYGDCGPGTGWCSDDCPPPTLGTRGALVPLIRDDRALAVLGPKKSDAVFE
jgi:hypothetical protein